MSLRPDELLEVYENASDRETAWVPLADWVHEQRPAVLGARPPQLEQANCELELVSRIPRRAFVNWVDDRPASQRTSETNRGNSSWSVSATQRVWTMFGVE